MLRADGGGGLWVLGPIHSCARDKCFRLFIRLEAASAAHSKWVAEAVWASPPTQLG